MKSGETETPKADWLRSLGGWFGAKSRHASPAPVKPDRPAKIEIRIGNCLDLIEQEENVYDAIVTDAPYSIALHGYDWDSTDISFSPALWEPLVPCAEAGRVYRVLRRPATLPPGRRPPVRRRDSRSIHSWAGGSATGLPKPINLAELFDRDNVVERDVIGMRRGSGFTQANVDHGAQNRSHVNFVQHARHVSPEAQDWRGYYYGVNALKPCLEPILLAQKPISTDGWWTTCDCGEPVPSTSAPCRIAMASGQAPSCRHRKAQKADHQSDHPSVKPVPLMEDICTLICPGGGRILDPFAGTGTTGVAARNKNFDCV